MQKMTKQAQSEILEKVYKRTLRNVEQQDRNEDWHEAADCLKEIEKI